MVEFIKIDNTESKEFADALSIYINSFPANERHPESLIEERVHLGLNILYIGQIESQTVFMALLWPFEDTVFTLLDYMATNASSRGQQLGSRFLQYMRPILKEKDHYFVLEVEDPEYGNNREERIKRVAYYKKNGALELKGLKYILPPLQGTNPTEMILMIFPEYANGLMQASIVIELVTRIYRELYNKDASQLLADIALNEKSAPISLI
ncbi:MAG: hypothetical protein WCF67_18930 [Chitinophagaceae bacterium]